MLGIANFTKPKLIDLDSTENQVMIQGMKSNPTTKTYAEGLEQAVNGIKNTPRGIFSATLNYAFNDYTSLGFGPYITFADWKKDPVVSLKVNFTLGGGKF